MSTFRDLLIWQKSMILVTDIYQLTNTFPKEEIYGLTSQIRRCAVSIPSNIAEGSSRTDKSFSHFVDLALGSSFELITQLIVAKHRKYIDEETFIKLEKKIEEFQRMTMSFQNGLKKSIFSIIPSIFYSLFSIF